MTILLLFGSNVFMTIAWYGHLKYGHAWPLWKAILISWGNCLDRVLHGGYRRIAWASAPIPVFQLKNHSRGDYLDRVFWCLRSCI